MKTKAEITRDKNAFGMGVLILALMLIFILITSGIDINSFLEIN